MIASLARELLIPFWASAHVALFETDDAQAPCIWTSAESDYYRSAAPDSYIEWLREKLARAAADSRSRVLHQHGRDEVQALFDQKQCASAVTAGI